ncbi:MAG: hypothetical protein ACYC64_09655 [Armatimonadota bacterium]
MTKRDVLSIALKILGVVSLAYGIVSIPNLVFVAGSPASLYAEGLSRMSFVWVEITSIVLYATIACWLIASSDLLARKMIRDDSVVALPASILERRAVFCLALRVLGVVFSVHGIALLGRVVAAMAFDHVGYSWASMQWSHALEMIGYIGTGTYLLFRSANAAALIYRDQPSLQASSDGDGDD